MARDGGGTRAVGPELLAGFRADGDEAFAVARIRQPDDLAGGGGHGGFVVADDVADQHHLGQLAALALGGIADRAQIAFVQVFQPGQDGAALLAVRIQVVLDLDDRRDRIARLAEEFHADRARVRRHAVQDPARGGDQAVAAFLLHAGQAGQEFVRDVLAQAFLAETAAFDCQDFAAQRPFAGLAAAIGPLKLEARNVHVVDLAAIVRQAGDFQPIAFRIHHAPPGQVVQRGAPQDGLLAAGVHGDVAADTGRLGGGGVHREHIAGLGGRVGHALGDDTGAGEHGRHGIRDAGQFGQFDLAQRFEFFGIDDGRSTCN